MGYKYPVSIGISIAANCIVNKMKEYSRIKFRE